jgi:hypothetical protein
MTTFDNNLIKEQLKLIEEKSTDNEDFDIEECSMYQDWKKEQYLKEEFGGTW